MNVLSLFDGISCGQLALQRAGVKVDKYFASEIDKYAMKVTQDNFPDTVQLGDVTKWNTWDLPKIDLLIGGSPCQGFSFAGKQLNFEDPRSKLFFEYVKVLQWIKPKYFLLENVKMKQECQDVISTYLGVQPVEINSRYFTGMIRKRLYWTNIEIRPYNKRDFKIKDIIDNNIEYNKDISYFINRTPIIPTISRDGIITINPKTYNGKQTWQRGRIYDIKGACPTICASLYDLNITDDYIQYRKLSLNECEKLQGLPYNYTYNIPSTQRGKCLGNGWTVDVIAHILGGIL